MTSTLHNKIFADRWYRFDRYEIKGGYICPAPNAKLEPYEPWRNFRSLSGKEAIKQPYEPLLHLAQEIDLDYSAHWPGKLLRGGEEKVVEWCSQYGLLGTLLHRVETIILPAEPRVLPFVKAPGQPRPVSTTFTRTNSGWGVGWIAPSGGSDMRPGVFLR